MFDLITIGDSLIDIFLVLDESSANCVIDKQTKKLCFNYADKMYIEHSTHSVGGNAANVATGTRKLGLKTAIVSELGDDLNGQAIINELASRKVDTSLIKIHKGKETRYSVVLNYKAERTILSYYVPRKYQLPRLEETKWIYYTSLGKNFEGLQDKLVLHLKKHPNTKLAMNPGSYQFRKGLKKIKQLLPMVDLLIVNKEEAEKIVGKKQAIPVIIPQLHKSGVKIVAVTDGLNGSYASDGEKIFTMKPYPITPIARTGAGDAYTSGFLSAIITGLDLKESIQWGTANASGVVQQFGAQKGQLNKKDLQKLIGTYPKVLPQTI